MRFYQIYKIEMFKLMKKRVTWVLLICLVLPLFYGVSIVGNASHIMVQGEFDALTFASINWNMLTMTGVPEILFALIAANTLASELEKGQLRQLVIKVCNRQRLVIAKATALISLMFLSYIIYCLFSIAIYYIFIVQTPLGTGEFLGDGIYSIQFVLMDLIYLIQIMIVANIVLLLGLHHKASVSFMMGIGITTLFIVCEFFGTVKYFIPAYIATALSYQQMSTGLASVLCIFYFLVGIIPIFITANKFEKIDIN